MTAAVAGLFKTRRKQPGPAPALRKIAPALLLSVLSLLGGAAVRAAEPAVPLDPPRPAQAPEPLCFCWNDGRKITEGATACIRTSQGRRLAACGRVTNVMSWHVTETPCPES